MTYALIKVGKVFHYRFQVGNIRVQRSTREKTKSRAEPIAQRAYDEALMLANGGKAVPTLEALANDWMLVHGPISSAAHARSVDTFTRLHLYDLGGLPINAITTSHIELARNKHLQTHKPASANHWLRIMKLIANWAVKREIIPALPWRVRMLKVQKRPRSILPIDAARAWFDAVDAATVREPSVGTAIRLMFGLGLRESEAAGARWEWIDWQRATYTPGITKGREAEPVPMPEWLADHLAPARGAEGLIAPRADGRQHPPGFARNAMRTANLSCSTKGLTPHRLRGTFATLLSESGVPIQTIQKVMRHKSPMTTMAYLEKNLDTAALAQNDIAEKIGFTRRESGEQRPANPLEHSL
jgi:integrase/recombinase XerC